MNTQLEWPKFDNETALHGEASAILFKKEFEGNDRQVEEIIKQKIKRNEENNKKREKKGKQPLELNPLLDLANKGPAILEDDETGSQENTGNTTITARKIDYER